MGVMEWFEGRDTELSIIIDKKRKSQISQIIITVETNYESKSHTVHHVDHCYG